MPISVIKSLHQGSWPSDANPQTPGSRPCSHEKLGGKVHASFFAFGDFDVWHHECQIPSPPQPSPWPSRWRAVSKSIHGLLTAAGSKPRKPAPVATNPSVGSPWPLITTNLAPRGPRPSLCPALASAAPGH